MSAAVQTYVVPAGINPFVPFTGVNVNGWPEQASNDTFVIAGVGFKVTVTVNVFPIQPAKTGVTVYTTVCDTFVVFVNNWLTLTCGVD